MARQERKRKSTPANRIKSFTDAMVTFEPPFALLKAEMKVFRQVVESREVATWTDTDLDVAAKLAQVTLEMNKVWKQYRKEGPTITSTHGTVVNPTLKAYNTMMTMYRAYRNQLGLNASARKISGHKQSKRNAQDAQARKQVASVSKLIAVPGK